MTRSPYVVAALLLVVAACGSAGGRSPNGADRTFLQDMIPHHERAITVAMLGIRQGDDPRVVAFARRIVREQTPELHAMQSAVTDAKLRLDLADGARTARNRITDAQVAQLRSLHGAAFDRRFVDLNISSEQGAAAMARPEVAGGTDAAVRAVAKGIASAPHNEIPELQRLAADLP